MRSTSENEICDALRISAYLAPMPVRSTAREQVLAEPLIGPSCVDSLGYAQVADEAFGKTQSASAGLLLFREMNCLKNH